MADPATGADRATITIERFSKARHDRRAFSCGFARIDNFFRNSVSEQVRENFTSVWVAVEGDPPAVRGFYAINAHTVTREALREVGGRIRREAIPAIYLHAVAVDRSAQNGGIGAALMIDAIRRSVGISQQMGAAVIVLDVLDDGGPERFRSRVSFYQRLGFTFFPGSGDRMYLRIKDAAASLR